jgi:hypothetical protein
LREQSCGGEERVENFFKIREVDLVGNLMERMEERRIHLGAVIELIEILRWDNKIWK